MPISIDSALGSLPEALALRGRRSELIASNLANADTPNYKARDFDFRAAMDTARSSELPLHTTQARHVAHTNSRDLAGVSLAYRVPNQPALDGNTVDGQVEQAAFAENAVNYQATLTFLSGRIRGLLTAIKGE